MDKMAKKEIVLGKVQNNENEILLPVSGSTGPTLFLP
jgi:hypothetical protein